MLKQVFAFYFGLIILSLGYGEVLAQNPASVNRNNDFWTELNLVGKIKGRFDYQFDYQCRQQADPSQLRDYLAAHPVGGGDNHGTSNMFAHPYQQVFRPWIHYSINDNVRVSISPVGWWGTWTTTQTGKLNFQPEFRTTAQVMFTHPLGRIVLQQRYRYEFRFFGQTRPVGDPETNYSDLTDPDTRKYRLRYMVRTYIPLNRPKIEPGAFYLNVYNELFIGLGKNTKPNRILDQNRFFAGLGYKFSPVFRLELGYLNQLIPNGTPSPNKELDINNVAQVFILIDDFNSFFRKRK